MYWFRISLYLSISIKFFCTNFSISNLNASNGFIPNLCSNSDILIPSIDAVALVAAMRKTTKHQLAEAKLKMEIYEDKYAGLIINRVDMMQYRKYNHDYDYFRTDNQNDKYEKNLKKKIKEQNIYEIRDTLDEISLILKSVKENTEQK